MLFNSFGFIFLFFPITLVLYFLLNRLFGSIGAKWWLLAASLFFYGWWNPLYLVLIVGSMTVNFSIGKALANTSQKKLLLIAGIAANLGLLFYYKYVDFFIETVNTLSSAEWPLLHIVLPLGISFFTFQQIAYLVDSYRGLTSEYNPISYGVFVSFFPQLVAGPIVHHQEMMPQFNSPATFRVNGFNLSKGLFIFLMGLAKKIVIADTFGVIANTGYAHVTLVSSMEAWITSLAYSLQLYFDFSGYSDMAIGLALMFNIRLPINFDSPYKSKSIKEFWRRWHMTLGRFLRDYVYIPLGGSKQGTPKTLANLFLTFLLGGIWHGAGWTFVIWGMLHGLALVAYQLLQKVRFRVPNPLAIVFTFLFVNFTWVFFRAADFSEAITLLERMVVLHTGSTDFFLVPNKYDSPIWLAGIILLFCPNSLEIGERFRPTLYYAVLVVLLFVLNLIFLNSMIQQDFLYFDF
ncbi:MAG: MBOAT family protein [Lunatimonas sp.]|uniref:MBOAT family O-acyltransferase n=1 Tax=Lunatimonas sp. TaxID=2060141 RepID=UPI00263BD7C3|nr:MBOAT family protein [Lunatimonas sp.]MCC5938581.1 MBOAT family protein [Lunatimonas sp.]